MLVESNIWRILELFFENPAREFYLREISRITRIPAASVHVTMKKLEKINLVTREKTPAVDKFKARIDERRFIALKRAHNLHKILQSEGLAQLITYADPKAVWMTGPYSQGRNETTDNLTIYCMDSKKESFQQKNWEKEIGTAITITHIPKRRILAYANILMEGALVYGHVD